MGAFLVTKAQLLYIQYPLVVRVVREAHRIVIHSSPNIHKETTTLIPVSLCMACFFL
jgi:hypothetical protein